MVRALLYVWVLTQIGILVQIRFHFGFLPGPEFFKVAETLVFIPIILILAHRTRQMRAYYMRHIHEDEEADEAAAKAAAAKKRVK